MVYPYKKSVLCLACSTVGSNPTLSAIFKMGGGWDENEVDSERRVEILRNEG